MQWLPTLSLTHPVNGGTQWVVHLLAMGTLESNTLHGLFGSIDSRGGNCIAMIAGPYTAYFDASGKKDQAVVTVCGFVSDAKKWAKFDAEWKNLLAGESLDYFHMTDFVAKKKPFDELAEAPERRDAFFRSLVGTATKRTNKSFAVMVPMDQYGKANKTYPLDEYFGGPYGFGGVGCMNKLNNWARKNRIQNLEICFEDGDEGKGTLEKFIKTVFLVTPLFKPKCDSTAFQAADLVAWECARFVKSAQAGHGDRTTVRKSFLELDRRPKDWGAVLAADIIATCKNLGVPRR
jgi:hypothetical protein